AERSSRSSGILPRPGHEPEPRRRSRLVLPSLTMMSARADWTRIMARGRLMCRVYQRSRPVFPSARGIPTPACGGRTESRPMRHFCYQITPDIIFLVAEMAHNANHVGVGGYAETPVRRPVGPADGVPPPPLQGSVGHLAERSSSQSRSPSHVRDRE